VKVAKPAISRVCPGQGEGGLQRKKPIDSQLLRRRIASKWSEVAKSRIIWTIDSENEAAFKWSPVALSIGHFAFFVSFSP